MDYGHFKTAVPKAKARGTPESVLDNAQNNNGKSSGGIDVRRPGGHTVSGEDSVTKPGDGLVFDCAIESGNFGTVKQVSKYEYDITMRSDTNNPRYRVWFYFRVTNIKSAQTAIFTVPNFSKTRLLYRAGMTPCVKSTSRPEWERLPERYVYYYKSPRHHKQYVVSWLFHFDRPREDYFFCYSFPFTYTKLQRELAFYSHRATDYFHQELLCRTVLNRRVDLITISSKEYLKRTDSKRVLFFTSRVHPGESPASWVLKGLMDFIMGSSPEAAVLRDNAIFQIVPMLNPDGVFLGNYRCSYTGYDLNRAWTKPCPIQHPPIYHTKQLLLQILNHPNFELDTYIDLHGHSTAHNGFMYGNLFDSPEENAREEVFPKLFDRNAKDFSLVSTKYGREPGKASTGRRVMGDPALVNVTSGLRPHCYTLEVSLFSSMEGRLKGPAYTPQHYMALGRDMGLTYVDYLELEIPETSEDGTARIRRRPRTARRMRNSQSVPSVTTTTTTANTSTNQSGGPLARRQRSSGDLSALPPSGPTSSGPAGGHSRRASGSGPSGWRI